MSNEMEIINESANAIQEIAKASGKAIDAGSKFGGFISHYIKGTLEQGMGIFEDRLKYMRWERQQRLMLRASNFLKEIGLQQPTKPIQLKFAVPLLEGASLEEDDELQDLWAKLLVNSANIESGIDLKRVYIDILERLTPLDAKILSVIYELPFEEIHHTGVFTSELPYKAYPALEKNKDKALEPSEEIKLSLASLSMIGCLSPTRTVGGGEVFDSVNPTILGRSFVRACTLEKAKI